MCDQTGHGNTVRNAHASLRIGIVGDFPCPYALPAAPVSASNRWAGRFVSQAIWRGCLVRPQGRSRDRTAQPARACLAWPGMAWHGLAPDGAGRGLACFVRDGAAWTCGTKPPTAKGAFCAFSAARSFRAAVRGRRAARRTHCEGGHRTGNPFLMMI